jgi:hypothetical protein
MLFAGKWMELEKFMLNEVSQAQKSKATYFSPFVEGRPIDLMYIYLSIYLSNYLSIYLSIVRERTKQ